MISQQKLKDRSILENILDVYLTMPLSSDEKKQIIKLLKEHTAIAEYAFKDALKKQTLSEEKLLFLAQNIEILAVLKPVISANRSGQKVSSEKNNRKHREVAKSASIKVQELEQENLTLKQKIDNLLKEFLDLESSEIYQLCQWLKKALSKTGANRDEALIEKELVHKEFYNGKIKQAEVESVRRDEEDKRTEEEYQKIVNSFQTRIDYLKQVNEKSQKFIQDNHGLNVWNELIK